jgi:hypothetical protein
VLSKASDQAWVRRDACHDRCDSGDSKDCEKKRTAETARTARKHRVIQPEQDFSSWPTVGGWVQTLSLLNRTTSVSSKPVEERQSGLSQACGEPFRARFRGPIVRQNLPVDK